MADSPGSTRRNSHTPVASMPSSAASSPVPGSNTHATPPPIAWYVRRRSKSSMWYFTDANYGMFERDIEIAHAVRAAVSNSNYFSTLSVNWAKNSSKYCTQIAHILSGISEPLIAVQSTDQEVLKAIKRANIKMETMTDMVVQSQQDGCVKHLLSLNFILYTAPLIFFSP